MTTAEFSRQFDVRFNNIDSNLAHSVTEYEKSLYLTQAQLEIIKNYFNPKGNKYQEGFDDSPKRDIDFSGITNVLAIGTGTPKDAVNDTITDRGFGLTSLQVKIHDNVLLLLNERFSFNGDGSDPTVYDYETTVVPIDYKQYQTILGKAYKDPPIRQTWRIIRNGDIAAGHVGNLTVELIPKSIFDSSKAYVYYVRYLKMPTPIVLEALTGGLTIQGVTAKTECILPPMVHEEILARAIEICKGDYLGDLQTQVELNKRSE